MTDPYKVLQVSPGASDEEVKSAYHELVRKYHPDNYSDNPLSDLATEKMKEINEAYDRIVVMRKSSDSRDYDGVDQGYAGNSSYSGRTSQFEDIRRLISMRRVTEAEELLDGVPRQNRDAEWHFLKGTVQQYRGWLDDAYDNYAKACDMDPYNGEYKNAFSQLQWQRQHARPRGGAYGSPQMHTGECSVCDVCAAMYCTSCLCDCMRGGC